MGGTYSNIGYTQENDEGIYEAVRLLKRALRKYSKTCYNSTVDDVPGFVSNFNKKTLEYEQRLGYTIVLRRS
jgi:hypothetical protein